MEPCNGLPLNRGLVGHRQDEEVAGAEDYLTHPGCKGRGAKVGRGKGRYRKARRGSASGPWLPVLPWLYAFSLSYFTPHNAL